MSMHPVGSILRHVSKACVLPVAGLGYGACQMLPALPLYFVLPLSLALS